MSCTVKVQELEPETNDLLKRLFNGVYSTDGYRRFGDVGCVVSSNYIAGADAIRNMTIRPDDVWIVTFPRSGTTMTQELVWLLKNNLDYEKASKVNLEDRYFFIETFTFVDEHKTGDIMETFTNIGADDLPSPRFFKTHLPLSLLPPNLLDTAKVVYVARDPRDAAVSFYHHNKHFKASNYIGDFKTYWKLFVDDLVIFTPYFGQVKEAWAQRKHPNMLFLFYEDIIKDLPSAIQNICEFFAITPKYTDEQIGRLCEHMKIDNFKKNRSVNMVGFTETYDLANPDTEPFIRKGKSGEWRQYFDDEMSLQADQWLQRHLADTDLRFPTIQI